MVSLAAVGERPSVSEAPAARRRQTACCNQAVGERWIGVGIRLIFDSGRTSCIVHSITPIVAPSPFMARRFIQKFLPTQEQIAANKTLRFLGPAILQPGLWHVTRRSVSVGVAIGLFCAFIIPVGQIPLAAVIAIYFRANLAVATLSTFVTNPFTFPAIYYVAYLLGSAMLGEKVVESEVASVVSEISQESDQGFIDGLLGWVSSLGDLGVPLLLGMVTFSVVSCVLGYFTVNLAWRASVAIRYRKRKTLPK